MADSRGLAILAACGALLFSQMHPAVGAEEFAPYGTAKAKALNYSPMKYALESSALDPADVADVFRVARQALSNSPASSQMSVIIIGGGIRVFAKENYEKYQAIVERAAELRDRGVKLVYCGESIKGAGFVPGDLHGIGEVAPAGYVEIADLVTKGYVHIRPPSVLQRTGGARYLDHPELRKK